MQQDLLSVTIPLIFPVNGYKPKKLRVPLRALRASVVDKNARAILPQLPRRGHLFRALVPDEA